MYIIISNIKYAGIKKYKKSKLIARRSFKNLKIY